MSFLTIQCRLVASEINFQGTVSPSEPARQHLWEQTAVTTSLVNDLLKQVALHPSFEAWQQQGRLPDKELKMLWETLKADPSYTGLPARFQTSAKLVVSEIYNSWLAIQKHQRLKLDGVTRWLEIVKSDAELVESSGHSFEQICSKAYEILHQLDPPSRERSASTTQSTTIRRKRGRQTAPVTPVKLGRDSEEDRKPSIPNNPKQLFSQLFEAYYATDESDILNRSAISHLIKNGCKVNETEENLEKLSKRLRKKKKEAERLQEQLASRLPRGRDPEGEEFLKILDIATQTVPQSEAEAASWQASLLRRPESAPFPILFFSNNDLHWLPIERRQHGKSEPQNRIFVRFRGLDRKYLFEVYCGRRQLPLFQQFVTDCRTHSDKQNQGKYSRSLFLLRSATLLWQEEQGVGKPNTTQAGQTSEMYAKEQEPWQKHQLYLHCTIETRCLSAEGTEQVKIEKTDITQKIITSYQAKEELSKSQQQALSRKEGTLARLDNSFPRPSRPQYQGNTDISMGISLGLDPPIAVAIVELSTGKVLLYHSIRQLLGDNYKLLTQYRHRQRQNANQRHKTQGRGKSASITESSSGEYIDRLIARAIVDLAQAHQASSIALPNLTGYRERFQSELAAKAEHKFPGNQTAQQYYAKQYRINLHRWNYHRLIQNIQEQAKKVGLAIQLGQQPLEGNLTQKAKELAMSAFHNCQPTGN